LIILTINQLKKELEQKIEDLPSLLEILKLTVEIEPLVPTTWYIYTREQWIELIDNAKLHITCSKIALILQSLLDALDD